MKKWVLSVVVICPFMFTLFIFLLSRKSNYNLQKDKPKLLFKVIITFQMFYLKGKRIISFFFLTLISEAVYSKKKKTYEEQLISQILKHNKLFCNS